MTSTGSRRGGTRSFGKTGEAQCLSILGHTGGGQTKGFIVGHTLLGLDLLKGGHAFASNIEATNQHIRSYKFDQGVREVRAVA
jgi:hypothetical protein